ncbi:mechanosensitive ion channel [Mucilaginibacter robiniae]|uniref:Mechanosensitive ion channel n=1 Tax=Mucilaginibacter robiniae TaxID=2728022 RepID=A0A7L5E8E5_9SPHI|nr:mechanosensitive ion channel domain-containing protein [Mucilaginibacter robiniae]QJD98124.1 mechanosensitive ion channel [Mucilaginibacter robiniae]
MMRYYKTSDTSTNNLLQKIEYYTQSYNQINNTLSRDLDTAEISAQIPRLEKTTTLIRNLINRDRSGTLRYLYAIRDILTHRQDEVDLWQDQLSDISNKLIDIHSDLEEINRDSAFLIFPTDSALQLTFLKQRGTLEIKAHHLDSLNKKNLLKIGLMQNRLTSVYIALIDEREQVATKIRAFSYKAFNCEYGYLWDLKTVNSTTFKSALDRTVTVNFKLFRLLSGETLTHVLGIFLLIGFFSWVYFNRRKIVKTKELPGDILAQTTYVAQYPFTSALLITTLIIPYVYDHPPVVFLELLFLVSISCVLYLVKKTCPPALFAYLGKLFFLTVLFSISNLFIEVSLVDRIAVLLLAAGVAWISFMFLRHVQREKVSYLPYSRAGLTLLILFEVASCVGNILGRFSLGKIIGVTAIYNFWLAICLYYLVQILVQSLFLQLEANKVEKNNISSYLDFKLLQSKFRNVLNIAALLMWLVMLLQNLNIEDSVFDFIGDFLTQSRKLGGTLFTFGSIIIFVSVIWLSSVLARIISYFYDFADQHKAGNTAQRKNRTSLLLIRIAVFSIGFLLAVGASGFPLDKITIIISALGVGVGFGLQNIVNNLVSGLILAFEKPVQIGDVIEVANRTGTIKEIGIRSSKIAAGNGAEIIIPNGDLISQHVINWTLSDSNRQVELNISVAYGCDVDQVKNILRNLLSNRDDIMESPAPVVYLNNLSPSSVDFKVQFWAADISLYQQLKSRVLSSIYKSFESEGIEVPKSTQDVRVYLPENGQPPINKNDLHPNQ